MPATNKKAALPESSRASSATASKPASKKRKMGGGEQKYYAVRVGYKPGVYTSWAICQQQISGYKGAIFKSFLSFEEASAFADGREFPTDQPATGPTRYYGLAVGRNPGVYTDWGKVQEALIGVKGPKYKRFDNRAEAEAFVRTYGNPNARLVGTVEQTQTEEVAEPPAKKVKTTQGFREVPVVYTDGSSLGNGKLGAAAGVGVYFGPNDPRNVSERLIGEPQTNQRAELTAILRALEIMGNEAFELRTDSKYAIQCVTEWFRNWERNGWRTKDGEVKNKDLVKAIRERLEDREARNAPTQFIWIKGHSNDPGNDAADQLAVAGARMAR